MLRELLGEEGLAEAARVDPCDLRRVGFAVTEQCELLGGLGEGERSECQLVGARKAASPGEPLCERFADVGILGAHRHDEREGLTAEELDEVEGRGVGPVCVLDDHAERLLVAQRGEQGDDRVEQPLAGPLVAHRGGLGRVELGKDQAKGGRHVRGAGQPAPP